MRNLIGLAGQAGAGKDYTFQSWAGLGYNVVRFSFADEVRQEVEVELGGRHIPELWTKPYTPMVRHMLQWWGTERRRQDEDYWVKLAMQRLAHLDEGEIAVFTDVRFPNEAKAIREAGGLVVRVGRPAEARRRALGMSEAAFEAMSQHPSETAVIDIKPDLYLIVDEEGPGPAIALARRLWGPLDRYLRAV